MTDRDAQPPHRARAAKVVAFALAAYALAVGLLVAILGFTDVWYGFQDLTDTPLYLEYATAMARGMRPYLDFDVEYPPLALSLFRIPEATGDVFWYTVEFNFAMLTLGGIAAALTAVCAVRLWPEGGRAYVAAAGFAACTLATGAIVANRYDAAVAVVIAAALLLISSRRWTWAAAVLGIGFALKLTPAILLPLVLILAGTRRAAARAALAFAAAAALPFVPYLGSSGIVRVFTYHLARPLQIESVLATPILVAHLIGGLPVTVGTAYGSQYVAAQGASALAHASGPLVLAALAAAYWVVWRRRALLRSSPRHVPIAALALVLAPMAFGKVLSPQFLVWTFPAAALVFAERRVLGATLVSILLLTQLEFPALYWNVVELQAPALVLVAIRNAALVAAFALATVHLARLPASTEVPLAEDLTRGEERARRTA
jgi:hypothetical protein